MKHRRSLTVTDAATQLQRWGSRTTGLWQDFNVDFSLRNVVWQRLFILTSAHCLHSSPLCSASLKTVGKGTVRIQRRQNRGVSTRFRCAQLKAALWLPPRPSEAVCVMSAHSGGRVSKQGGQPFWDKAERDSRWESMKDT